MKKMLHQITGFISVCLIAFSVSSAQITNAGFENWTNGSPDGWEALTNFNIPGVLVAINITQVTDAHSGNSALRGEVISSSGKAYPPVLDAGQSGIGIPYTGRDAAFTGYYKFVPAASGDKFEIVVITFKNGWLGGGIGYGSMNITASATAYTQFSVPITFLSSSTPDSVYIMFAITNSSKTTVGSYFQIDDLSFGVGTGVEEHGNNQPFVFSLNQNYPNPFNPSTNISYQIPANGMVRLDVFDIMGRTVSTLVNGEKPAGQYTLAFDGSKLTSGIYFYRINVISRNGKTFSQTNKMMLMK